MRKVVWLSAGTAGVCSRPSDVKGWELNINNRYFKSYKHFVGTVEQKQREEEGTNVINHSYEMDVTAIRTINSRWSVTVTLPIMAFARSSLYEHDNLTRHSHTFILVLVMLGFLHTGGCSTRPNHTTGNIQLGLGIKLPTGNYNYQDYFYKKADSSVLGPVDQSHSTR